MLMKGLTIHYFDLTQNIKDLINGLYKDPVATGIQPIAKPEKNMIAPVIFGIVAGMLVLAVSAWHFGFRKEIRNTENPIEAAPVHIIETEPVTETESATETELDDIVAEPVNVVVPDEPSAWNKCRILYAQRFDDIMNQYPIAPSANPFDGEVKGFCYSALAGNCEGGLPYLILCWRGDNEIAIDIPGADTCYAYFYEIWEWDGNQPVLYVSSGTGAQNAINKYWLSRMDGIDYWVTWNYTNGKYEMIPLEAQRTRRTFSRNDVTAQYYTDETVVDEDTYLQMCSLAEATNNDDYVSMTRTAGYQDLTESVQFIPASIDNTYKQLTGDSLTHKGNENDWKRLYRKYLKKLGLHKTDTALIDLFYLNDDDIPEMLIKQTSDSLYYIIVTFDGSAIDIVMAPFANLKAVERKNHFMLWSQPDDYIGFAYVLTIQDGAFQWNTHGCFSTKEITEKISNYVWNNEKVNHLQEYQFLVDQQVPDGVSIIPGKTYDEMHDVLMDCRPGSCADAQESSYVTGEQRYAKEYLRILEEYESELIPSESEKAVGDDSIVSSMEQQSDNPAVEKQPEIPAVEQQTENPVAGLLQNASTWTQNTDESGRLIHTIIYPAILIDVCGDPTPELLFVTDPVKEDVTSGSNDHVGSVLHIYTFNGYSCEEVLNQKLEEEGYDASWCLFQTSGQKNLWLYTSTGTSGKKCTYTKYSLMQGAFKIDDYLLRYPSEDNSYPVCIDSDVQVSEEYYLQKESELAEEITSILQWNRIEAENTGLMNKVISLCQGAKPLDEIQAELRELAE